MTVCDGATGLALLDAEAIQNPHPLYERMHTLGEVHPIGESGFHAVSGWRAINDVLARPEDFSSNLTATIMRSPDGTVSAFPMDPVGGPTHVLATADDPSHATHRKMLVPRLAARRIRALEPMITEALHQLWAEELHSDAVEWMSAVANRLPMMIVGRLVGVPVADIDQLTRWGYASTQLLEGLLTQEELAAAGTAALELSGYIAEHFQRAAADPGDNLLGDLATACAAGELDTLTAQIMMITLFSAGGESTASLLGSAVYLLTTRPDLQARLRDDPGLLGVFLEEVLRYESPFRGHYRHVLRDTTIGVNNLAAGSRLLLLWGAANRDPAQFSNPDEFRIDRPQGKGHLGFGKGAHFCVGAALARQEARLVVGELLRRTSWVDASKVGPWLPSLLVRRLASLEINMTAPR